MSELDQQLSRLLRDAVADVDPDDRYDELRARTAAPGPRRWWLAAGGASLAAAAVVVVVSVVVGGQPTAVDPGPADPPSSSSAPTAGSGTAVAAYFVGDSPTGPRLYREFQQVPSPAPGLAGLELLETGPVDPDYTSAWPAGSFERLSDPEAGVVHVYLTEAAPELEPLAEQQVVYTVSAGFQEPLSVVFHRGADQSAPVPALPQLEVLSLVNLSDPAEGRTVSGDLAVRGVASSNEATVPWRIEREGDVVDDGFFTAEGWMGTRLFPFSGDLDVSSLDPGTYTLIVETDDASGGAEGPGSYSDSRTFVLE
jgi:hypothetical protein